MLCIYWKFNKYQSISNIYQMLLYLKCLYRKVKLLKGIDSFQIVSWLYFWFGVYTAQLSSEVEKWLSFPMWLVFTSLSFHHLLCLGQGSILSVCITIYGPVVEILKHPCKCTPVYITCAGPSPTTSWAAPYSHNQRIISGLAGSF